MTTPLREALTERINQVGPIHPDIEELVGMGEQRLRRHRLAAVVGAGAAVALAIALAIGGTAMIRSADRNRGPIDRPPNPDQTQGSTPTTRPIVYSDDIFSNRCDEAGHPFFCVGILHVGDREVRIDQALGTARGWPMHVTDTGAVYPNDDGLSGGAWSSVWFTDGGAPQRIARQACPGYGYPDLTVTTGRTGPLAAWVDCSAQGRGDLVVFDTGAGHEVARVPIPGCRAAETKSVGGRLAVEGCRAVGVVAGHVYFARAGYDRTRNRAPAPRLLRLDVVSGDVVAATPHMYAQEASSDPRVLVIGDSWRTGSRDTGGRFDVVGSRLVPMGEAFDPASNEFVRTRTRAFDAATGQPVRFRLPGGYHPKPAPSFSGTDVTGYVTGFEILQWLDDETVALAQESESFKGRDIITCHLPDGRCHLAVKSGSPDELRVVAGDSLPG